MFCSSWFFYPFIILLYQSLFPIFNLRYAQLLFTVRGWSCVEGGAEAHEESVQGEGGGGYRW